MRRLAAQNADDSYSEFVDRALELTPAERLDDASRRTATPAALAELSAKLRTAQVPVGPSSSADVEVRRVDTNEGPFDLVFAPAGTRGYDDLRRDAIELDLGVPVLVASLRDVIRMTEASNRPYDTAKLPALKRATLERGREREQP